MSFDLNDAELQKSGDLIPDGTFAKVVMVIRPGGVDGDAEVDRGLLKRSATPGSDVLLLDCEFTVIEGPYARRKFWQTLTASGGKLDETGNSIGARITKGTLRAMIDSAHGLDPEDMGEAAKSKRVLRGYADLSGTVFVGKIKVEASNNPAYSDRNKLDRVVVPTESEWRKIMEGGSVPACPSSRPRIPTSVTASPPAGTPQLSYEAPLLSSMPPSGRVPATPTVHAVGRPCLAEGLGEVAKSGSGANGTDTADIADRGVPQARAPPAPGPCVSRALCSLRARGARLRLRPPASLGSLPLLPILLTSLPRPRLRARQKE
jgi:hypothetical protein